MAYEINKILADEHILKAEKNIATFSIWLKGIPNVEIQIAIVYSPHTEKYNFYQSHFIKTPEQSQLYTPCNTDCEYVAHALHRAVNMSILNYYKIAIQNNHTPNSSWLVENRYFIFDGL